MLDAVSGIPDSLLGVSKILDSVSVMSWMSWTLAESLSGILDYLCQGCWTLCISDARLCVSWMLDSVY